jgi:hypothetical protein
LVGAAATTANAACGDAGDDRPVDLILDIGPVVGALAVAERLNARGPCFATLREHPSYRSQFS